MRDCQALESEIASMKKTKSALEQQVRELRSTTTQAVNRYNLQSVALGERWDVGDAEAAAERERGAAESTGCITEQAAARATRVHERRRELQRGNGRRGEGVPRHRVGGSGEGDSGDAGARARAGVDRGCEPGGHEHNGTA